jgi:hypothetical protein
VRTGLALGFNSVGSNGVRKSSLSSVQKEENARCVGERSGMFDQTG